MRFSGLAIGAMYNIKPVKPADSNFTILQNRVKRMPNEKCISYKTASENWVSLTGKSFLKYVNNISKGFLSQGIKRGDKIGVMAHTSFEWVTIDFAAWSIGAVVVPIYETSSAHQIEFVCNDSEISYLYVENETLLQLANSVRSKLKTVTCIKNLQAGALDELEALGAGITPAKLKAAREKVRAEDIATIVYTSGSTGKHKGVEIQHKAFISVVYSSNEALPELLQAQGSSILLFLPLAHVFARFAVLAVIEGVSTLALSGSIDALLNDLRNIKPNYIIGVPRIFEKVYNAASQKAGTGIKGKIFKKATQAAIEYSKSLDTPEGASPGLIAKRAIFDRLVYAQIKTVLGGKMRNCVCGGAALNPDIAHFFRGVGVNVLEGYGLTEITAPAMCNRVTNNKIGTIGQPFAGVEVKIAPDGELLIKTPSSFKAYHNQPELTKQVLKNGWLYTGDLAEEDDEGFISLVGRKKDIIVTSGGKNVSPGPLEQVVENSPLVSNCVVVGDDKPFIAALITLDLGGLEVWAKGKHLENLTEKSAAKNKAVHGEIQQFIDLANEQVSRAESIRKFVILPEQFTIENGCQTATMKIIRRNILSRFAKEIENGIYKK